MSRIISGERVRKGIMKMTYTYTNNFHNTEFKTRKSPEELTQIDYRIYAGEASKAEKVFKNRMKKALCLSDDCKCGDTFGRR
jgi:hypothetical protein